MKSLNIFAAFLIIILSQNIFAQEPEPESFFPTHVGNLWQYYGVANLWEDWSILRDSIAEDGYRYLYIDNYPRGTQPYWRFRLDSAFNVYEGGPPWWSLNIFRQNADSGDVWLYSGSASQNLYAWVENVMEEELFGKESIIKVIKSGPSHPDSGGNEFWFTEQHYASGFGVIYHKEEPFGEVFLRGCVIDGDTLGFVTSVEDIEYDLPESFVLKQNYPNPFNSSTTIKYSIPSYKNPLPGGARGGLVTLKIYDVLGNEVAVLVNEAKSPGEYEVIFNASNLSSGVYYYKLTAGDFTNVKKLMLLK